MESTRIQQIQKMLRSEPLDDFLNYALALEYEKEGKIHQAASQIETILKRNEQYSGAYHKLGALLEQLGETSRAADAYKKGMEINKNNRKTYNELQEALQNLMDTD
ncbi:MAG TPA: tetratricopeptide repeat protein [Bacteroidia bacterium]|nr:tetratricopeptide repeat protein [Bacteroidia bacterium]